MVGDTIGFAGGHVVNINNYYVLCYNYLAQCNLIVLLVVGFTFATHGKDHVVSVQADKAYKFNHYISISL